MQIVWKPVPIEALQAKYEISDCGQVRNTRTARVLKPMKTGDKRKSASRSKVRLSTSPRIDVDVAWLVLTAFVRHRQEGECVLHKNDDPHDNRLSNLRWATQKENALDSAIKCRGGTQKIGPEQISEIFSKRSAGVSGKKLAEEYGISQQRVCDIYKQRSAVLKHVIGRLE